MNAYGFENYRLALDHPTDASARGRGGIHHDQRGRPQGTPGRWMPDRNVFDVPNWPSLRSLVFLETIGVGSFGRVRLARTRAVSALYVAVKCIKKTDIQRKGSVEATWLEIEALNHCTSCPFIVKLFGAFQTFQSVYLIMQYCAGGELLGVVARHGRLPEEVVRFYAVELCLALRYLHESGWAYRDLKPDNLMLSHSGHLVMADFGLATRTSPGHIYHDRAVGTIQYLAPEIVRGRIGEPKGIPVDWWACGCVLYELVCGRAPFGETTGLQKQSKYEVINRIIHGKVRFPQSCHLSAQGSNFLRSLLCSDQNSRLGWSGACQHAWLSGVDWEAASQLRLRPPIVPALQGPGDRSMFTCKWPDEAMEPGAICEGAQVTLLAANPTSTSMRFKSGARISLTNTKRTLPGTIKVKQSKSPHSALPAAVIDNTTRARESIVINDVAWSK